MVFTVLSAVELNGKCNFELLFPAKPSIAELRARVDRDLGMEAQLRRPNIPFAVSRVQVFDERLQMWVDLVAAVQLEDYCQLYVFQVESPYCRDLPGHIPPPQRPTAAGAGSPVRSPLDHPEVRGVSPQRLRAGSPEIVPPQDLSPFRQRQREIDIRASAGDSPAPAHSDKVRTVYDDLDAGRSRKVNVDDWRQTFARLRLQEPEGTLTPDTVEDLFARKADRNSDSVVTFQEFARFAENYPKLLDSLYYRSRALVHERARKDNIERSKEELDALQKRLDEAQDAHNQQESAVLEQKQALERSEEQIRNAQDEEQDAKKARDRAHQESEDDRQDVREKTATRDRAKEDVRARDGELRAQQRNMASAEKKRDQKQADVDRASRERERLRQLLAQQEQECAKQEQELEEAGSKVDDEKAKADEIDGRKRDAEGVVNDAQGQLSSAEQALKQKLDDEAAAAKAHREKQQKLQQAQAQADREQKELQAQQQKAEARKRAQSRAEETLDEHRKVVGELEEKDRTLDDARKQEQSRENTIVEAEIRLREQRDAVEEKEQALSQAANEFAAETGRVRSPGQPGVPP